MPALHDEPPDVSRAPGAETLALLHLAVERAHDRPAAIQRRGKAGALVTLPDWRLHRQIIRLGLYMSERAGLSAGERVAIVAPVSFESIVAEWATIVQGGVAATVDPGLDDAELARSLRGARRGRCSRRPPGRPNRHRRGWARPRVLSRR